jgi:hypothetical protein
MTKWSAELEPWVHLYGSYDWSDTWANVSMATAGGVSTVSNTGAVKVGSHGP